MGVKSVWALRWLGRGVQGLYLNRLGGYLAESRGLPEHNRYLRVPNHHRGRPQADRRNGHFAGPESTLVRRFVIQYLRLVIGRVK